MGAESALPARPLKRARPKRTWSSAAVRTSDSSMKSTPVCWTIWASTKWPIRTWKRGGGTRLSAEDRPAEDRKGSVGEAHLSHDRDGDGLDDLFDHLGVRLEAQQRVQRRRRGQRPRLLHDEASLRRDEAHHARDAALATDVGRDTLESHDGASASLL